MRISDWSSDVCSSDLERFGAAGAVLYFDVNDLKAINDRYGHAAGDAVLKQICEILLRETRASDVVGRLGGDEFGVILAQSALEPAAAKAAKLADTIAAEGAVRSEEHTSELQSLMRISYAVFCLK